MKIGHTISLRGFVTKRKCVVGQSLHELEKRLGFQRGRFCDGVLIAILAPYQPLPTSSEFELRGYSQVADHRFNGSLTAGLNMDVLKSNAIQCWEKTGPDSLVKIIPIKGHEYGLDNDIQYPIGTGVPQWKLIKELAFTVVAEVTNYPEGRWVG